MNYKVNQDTERITRGQNAEYKRDKQAEQKAHSRPDDATIIVSKPSLKEKWEKRREEKRSKKK